MVIPMTVSVNSVTVPVSMTTNSQVFDVAAGAEFNVSTYPDYAGEYEFTPSSTPQTISTRDMVVHGDIVIDPIPNNYGLITWDGTTITVS